MTADAGIKFGSYLLLRRIARGGMAEVFVAQQRGPGGFDRRVAVKRILPHLADAPDFVKMFLGEARLAAQLTHPNVVHIYEFGKVDSDFFIAMEFVDGVHAGELFRYGEHHAPLPPMLVARMGADAAAALHHAHEQRDASGQPIGLVHRDVSPANIMVSYDGVVKLCDFGIAKAAAASDQLTRPGEVKGKYAYMSPEQTTADKLDGRSDVFSLAIVMYELLAGRHMVPRGDAVAAMRMIRDGKLEPLARAAPRCPPDLARAVSWALETKRDHRATAAEFTHALETVIKSSPDLATPMQLGTWIRERFARLPGEQLPPVVAIANQTVEAEPSSVALDALVTPSSVSLLDGTEIRETVVYNGGQSSTDRVLQAGWTLTPSSDRHAVSTSPDATVIDAPLTPSQPSSRAAMDAPTVLAGDLDSDSGPKVTRTRPPSPVPPAPPRADPTVPGHLPSSVRPRATPPAGMPRLPIAPRFAETEHVRRVGVHGPATWFHARVDAIVERYGERRVRTVLAAGALVGLALLSFAIALFATHHRSHPAPTTGTLTLRTHFAASVYEHEQKLGDTPLVDRELSVGTHVLELRSEGRAPITQRVDITADTRTELDVPLEGPPRLERRE